MSSTSTFLFEKYIELAEHISRHPCLFDSEHPSYHDQTIRDNVWADISNAFTITIDDCKKHWRNMIYTYNKMKLIAELNTGSTIKINKSELILANSLSFLDVEDYDELDLLNQVQLPYTNDVSYSYVISTTKCEQWNDTLNELMKVDDHQLFEVLYETITQLMPDLKNGAMAVILRVVSDLSDIVFEPSDAAAASVSSAALTMSENDSFIENLIRKTDEKNNIIKELVEVEDDSLLSELFASIMKFNPDLRIRAKIKILCIVRELLERQTYIVNQDK